MANIPNPTDVDAVIVCDQNGDVVMVVPEEFEIYKDEDVKWVTAPPNQDVELTFGSKQGSPFNWDTKKSAGGNIDGRTLPHAKARAYKYSVTGGNNTIDPRLRIRG
jgi:hypothetical protein